MYAQIIDFNQARTTINNFDSLLKQVKDSAYYGDIEAASTTLDSIWKSCTPEQYNTAFGFYTLATETMQENNNAD